MSTFYPDLMKFPRWSNWLAQHGMKSSLLGLKFQQYRFQWVPPFFKFPQSSSIQNQLPLLKEIVVSLSSFKHWLTVFGYVLVDVPGAEKNGTSWEHMPHHIYQDQIPVNCNHWRIRDSTVKRLDILLCPCMGVWIWVWPDINAVLLFVYELELFCEEAVVSGSCCSNEESTVCGLALAWVKAMPDPNWVSSRHWCIGCSSSGEAGWLWLVHWQQISTFHQLFCHLSQMDNCWAWMIFCLLLLPLDDFELLGTFLQNHIWLWYFSLLSNFWLHSHSVLHDYCSIKAGIAQYQILLKEVMLKQRFACYSWLLIKTFNVNFFSHLSCIQIF